MATATKKIALFGLFGSGNNGNDASLEAMLVFLRRARPDAELVCLCEGPESVSANYRVTAIPINDSNFSNAVLRKLNGLLLTIPRKFVTLYRTFKLVRDLDVLIMPGSGILDDFGDVPFGMPYALFRYCLVSRLCGVKVAFVSTGAGPMLHPLNRWFLKSAARLAHYRSYRDQVSKTFIASIGIDTRNDLVFPDAVFGLPTSQTATTTGPGAAPLRVGVGLMTYYGHRSLITIGGHIYDAYLRKISRFVGWLLDNGYYVRLIIGDAFDRRAVNDVVNAIAAEKRALPPGQLVAEPIETFHDVLRQMADTDAIIASRFHNLVGALKLYKPTLSLGYRTRHDELLTDMGLGAYHQHIETFDVDLLIEQFSTMISKREEHARIIRDRTAVYRERLRQQEQLLLTTLLN